MKHGVEAHDVEIGGRDRGQVVGVGDLELEIGPRLGLGKLDAQRQRIDAQHVAAGPDQIGDMLGQQAGAAADIEHALARRDREVAHQHLARQELAIDAHAIVVSRQRVVVLGE